MAPIVVGGQTFRIRVAPRDGRFAAHAVRADSGDRFGPAVTSPSEDEAVSRLTAWLEWQSEHAAALTTLQEAERLYHRAIAGAAFVRRDDEAYAQARRQALEQVERARTRLDAIRARRPLQEAAP